jgi:glycosyltransferase involved in cell wall biosynthesis
MVRSARGIVLPSEWYENAPMSVLESYALGKPVIGASIGGIPELVRPGDTGFRYTSGNVTELAEVLRHVCDMPDREVAEMGRRGRLWVDTEFTSVTYVARILDAYRELGVTTNEAMS